MNRKDEILKIKILKTHIADIKDLETLIKGLLTVFFTKSLLIKSSPTTRMLFLNLNIFCREEYFTKKFFTTEKGLFF